MESFVRQNVWNRIADKLLKDYESLRGSKADPATKGDIGDPFFRKWLSIWLPKRVIATKGIIVDKNQLTTGRDCIIFDHLNSAIFSETRDDELSVLPIEGVVGLIEVNSSEAKKTKIMHDIDKLAEVCAFNPTVEPDKHLLLIDKNKSEPMNRREPKMEKIVSTRSKPFNYIFAHDYESSLESLAKNVAEKNKELGVDYSVDGVFILQKGYILHGEISEGWCTTRLKNKHLYWKNAEPKDVLLTLSSMVIQHLAFGIKGSMPMLEQYFGDIEKRRLEMQKDSVKISDSEYSQQDSIFKTVS